MKSSKFWIVAIGLFFVLSCVAAFAVYQFHGAGNIACVYQSGELIDRINLDTVTTPYSFRVENDRGDYNVISVEPGRIRVSEASCPDHICMNTGWISDGVFPIVCLPNELVIQIEGGGSDDLDAGVQ